MVKNEWEKLQAAKRGGGQVRLPLDFDSAEGRYLTEPASQLTPEETDRTLWKTTSIPNP